MLRRLIVVLSVAIATLAGCAAPPAPQEAFPFDSAIRTLTMNVMKEFRDNRLTALLGQITATSAAGLQRDSATILLDPFVEANTGDVTDASTRVTAIMTDIIKDAPNTLTIAPLSTKGFNTASYSVVGKLTYEPYYNSGKRLYRAYASVVDLTTGKVLANSNAWIADQKVTNNPVGLYSTSPMYLKDAALQRQLDAAAAKTGSSASGYVADLEASVLTSEANDAYNQRDLRTAIELYRKSIALPAGHSMKNYSGLYRALYVSGRLEEAGAAFTEMFALGVASNNTSLRFLFTPGATEFYTRDPARGQYELWLRQSAKYLAATNRCLDVIGYASAPGDAAFNKKLSGDRAVRIMGMMTSFAPSLAPPRIRADGKGSSEAIYKVDVDDDQNRVDRRVEFKIRGC